MVRSQSRGGNRSGYGSNGAVGLNLQQNNQLVFSAAASANINSPQS
jgi:hypothetical protein